MANTAWPTVIRRLVRPAFPADGLGSDADLLARFVARRDSSAFADLVRRHGPMVLGVCRRILRHEQDAEDAFQATFLALAGQAAAVARGPALPGWLHTAAFRIAIRAKSRRRSAAQADETIPAPDREPAEAIVEMEWRGLLDEELSRLPEKYRLPVVLCYLQGRSNTEAAAALGCPRGTVDSRLATARQRLRNRLARRGVVLSAGWTAAALTTTVAPQLTEAAAHHALIWLTNPAGLSGAAAPLAALAEGVTMPMALLNLKTLVAFALGLTILGAGLGAAALTAGKDHPGASAQAAATSSGTSSTASQKAAGGGGPTQPTPGGAPAAGAPPREPSPRDLSQNREERQREISRKLSSEFPDLGRAEGVTLQSVLEFIAEKRNMTILIETVAFRSANIEGEVEQQQVKIPNLKSISLASALSLILSQVGATYVVRDGALYVVPTTNTNNINQPVMVDARDEPLAEVLRQLVLRTGANIALDPRTKEKSATKISVRLQNVPLATAVEVLADMADLQAIVMGDSLLYVTDKTNQLAEAQIVPKTKVPAEKPAASGPLPGSGKPRNR